MGRAASIVRSGVTPRRCFVVALVAAAAVLMTGCLRTEVAVVVEDDGSGRIDLDVWFEESALDGIGLTSDGLLDLAEAATTGVDGAEVSGLAEDGARGIRMSLPFDDHRQLADSLTNADVQGQQLRIFQSFEIEESDAGRWSLDAQVDRGGFASVLAEAGGLLGIIGPADSAISVTFSVTLPGEVTASNADRSDGGTATWDLDQDGGPRELTMETAPASSSMLLWIAGAAVALVVLLLLVVVVRRRGAARRSDRSDGTGWAPPDGGPGAAPGAAPSGWGSPPTAPPGWEPASAPAFAPPGPVGPGPAAPAGPPQPPTAPFGLPQGPSQTAGPALPPAPPLPPVAAPPAAPPPAAPPPMRDGVETSQDWTPPSEP